MSGRRAGSRVQTRPVSAGAAADEAVTDGFVDAAQEAIEQTLEAFSSRDPTERWYGRAYRVIDESKPYEHLLTFPVDELEGIEERLHEFGSGLYCVRVFKGSRIFKQARYSIYEPERKAAPAAAVDATAGLAAMMEQQNRFFAQMMERMDARIAAVAQPAAVAVDPMLAIERIASAMKAFQTAVPTPAPPDPMMGVNLFMQAFELANKLRGEAGGEGESSWMDVVRDGVKSVPWLDIAQAFTAQQRPPAPQPRTAPLQPVTLQPRPVPENTQVPPAPPPLTMQQQQEQLAQLKVEIERLVKRAAKGSPTDESAGTLFDDWGPEAVKFLMGQPDFLQRIELLVPEVVQYRPWFAELVDVLKEMLQDFEAPAREEDDDPPPNGSADGAATAES